EPGRDRPHDLPRSHPGRLPGRRRSSADGRDRCVLVAVGSHPGLCRAAVAQHGAGTDAKADARGRVGRMKIALVSPYDYPFPGGVTSHIMHLDEEFTRLGHAVRILAPSSLDEADLAARRVVKLGSVVQVPANGSVAR